MRTIILTTIFWLLTTTAFTQTNISGIINTYHKVTGIDYTQSGVVLDDFTGIAMGDRVMLIQMKGATVNTTSSSSGFGSVTDMNHAGNYEMLTVCTIRNDSVFFIQQLFRTYDVADKVQLVKIPRYVNANVTGTLEAAIWDSVSGKGGVLALVVSGTLTLHAPVTATAKGFKGGTFYKDAGGCVSNAFQNYAYDPTSSNYLFYTNVQRGSWKGESIATLPLLVSGGRGASANGGGGGNNHNNGGGGGSNLAMGGKGGDNQSTTGCQGSFAGIGGYALSSNGGERIFPGGGGGAGHANNTTVSAGGGYGGGIVFIQAEQLVSNGFTISANGGAGGNTFGDGAAGGGGGGTILLSINHFDDAVSVEARGGNGGQEDDELISGRCYGEGGGGGGGVIYFKGAQPPGTVQVNGGVKGGKIFSTCATTTGSDGSAGMVVTHYDAMESGTASVCAGTMLDAKWKRFTAGMQGNNVLLQWSVTVLTNDGQFILERRNNDRWVSIASLPVISAQKEYQVKDVLIKGGAYQYRVKWVKDQKTMYSSIQQVLYDDKASMIQYDAMKRKLVIAGAEKDAVVEVYDLSGQRVYQFRTIDGTKVADVSFLRTGVYIARTSQVICRFLVR